jgi:hypothetical protein
MASSNPIRWLHLSDLHLGCRGTEVWWQVHSEFRDSIKQNRRPIDLILLTGDLTNKGDEDEFKKLDHFLGELNVWLKEAGQTTPPVVIPVPGNHDLVRPKGRDLRNLTPLKNFGHNPDDKLFQEFKGELWDKRDASAFDPLFKNYRDWFDRTIRPGLNGAGISHVCSHFPGDLSVRIDRPGAPPLTAR